MHDFRKISNFIRWKMHVRCIFFVWIKFGTSFCQKVGGKLPPLPPLYLRPWYLNSTVFHRRLKITFWLIWFTFWNFDIHCTRLEIHSKLFRSAHFPFNLINLRPVNENPWKKSFKMIFNSNKKFIAISPCKLSYFKLRISLNNVRGH